MTFDAGAFSYGPGWRPGGDRKHRWGSWQKGYAREQGASDYQMYQLQERAKKMWGSQYDIDPETGLRMDKVWNPSQFSDQGSPWDYAAQGGYGFELADVHAIDDLDKVKEYKKWGIQHGLRIGGGVDSWIRGKEQDIRNAEAEAFRRETLAAQMAHQQEMDRLKLELEAKAYNVRSSDAQGVGGNANFRGARLNTTTPGGGGTRRFSRTNPLFISQVNAPGASAGQSSTVNV